MDDLLYREEILDHYYASPYRGQLDAPAFRAEMDNPLCGDRLSVGVQLDSGGRIGRFRFEGQGCVISQASASVLGEHVEGKTLDEVRSIGAEEMQRILGIRLGPARLKCALLSLWTLRRALGETPRSGNTVLEPPTTAAPRKTMPAPRFENSVT